MGAGFVVWPYLTRQALFIHTKMCLFSYYTLSTTSYSHCADYYTTGEGGHARNDDETKVGSQAVARSFRDTIQVGEEREESSKAEV